jgi:hypothetical protein
MYLCFFGISVTHLTGENISLTKAYCEVGRLPSSMKTSVMNPRSLTQDIIFILDRLDCKHPVDPPTPLVPVVLAEATRGVEGKLVFYAVRYFLSLLSLIMTESRRIGIAANFTFRTKPTSCLAFPSTLVLLKKGFFS